MDELMALLRDCCPQVDFSSHALVDDGELTSLDLVAIVVELNETYDISISADDLVPENFNSAEAIFALVERLR